MATACTVLLMTNFVESSSPPLPGARACPNFGRILQHTYGLTGTSSSHSLEPSLARRARIPVEGIAWGDHTELQAISQMLKVRIVVVSAAPHPLVFGEEWGDIAPVLHLSYHRHLHTHGEHYNSLHPKGASFDSSGNSNGNDNGNTNNDADEMEQRL
eukprot:NODE_6315_length_584_cov_25.450467_g5904_i0.p1 GENE.NODE_6315_length_584_cov_25.450467_g5904_i0~~NODE_6315_length_584_cov_25.450467_g5904_i0.p1  ORF type:complete len:157 (-),score=25.48 NODE_6315_length_584_cov_25.450467_g5904_i0:25-495(-)